MVCRVEGSIPGGGAIEKRPGVRFSLDERALERGNLKRSFPTKTENSTVFERGRVLGGQTQGKPKSA